MQEWQDGRLTAVDETTDKKKLEEFEKFIDSMSYGHLTKGVDLAYGYGDLQTHHMCGDCCMNNALMLRDQNKQDEEATPLFHVECKIEHLGDFYIPYRRGNSC